MDDSLHPELAAEGILHRAGKGAPGMREVAQRHRQNPLELQERFFIENDRVELLRLEAALFEAPLDRRHRKVRVALAPGEPLLLDRTDRHPVDQKGSRGIVIVGGDAEDLHQYWPRKVAGRFRSNQPGGSRRAALFARTAKMGRMMKYWARSMTLPSTAASATANRR